MSDRLKRNGEYLLLALLIAGVNLCLLPGLNQYIYILLEIVFFLAAVYLLLFNKRDYYYILIFSIPLSIQLDLGFGNAMTLPSEFLAALLALFLLGMLIRRPLFPREVLMHPLTLLLALDVLWMLVCSFYSNIPLFSYKRTLIRSVYLLLYYLLAIQMFRNPLNLPRLFLAYALGMVYPVISAFIFHWKSSFGARAAYKMTMPFFNDHTIYGAALAFVLPLVVVLAIDPGIAGLRRKFWAWLWALSGLLALAFFLSFSRAAWLSMVLALLFALLLRYRVRFVTVITGMAAVVLIALLNFGSLTEAVKRNDSRSNTGDLTEHVESMSNIQSDASNAERINRWKCALRMFRDKPVFGFGPGTYQYSYGVYQVRSEMTRISTVTGNRGHAHSEYLTYLSETGLPGLLIFIAQLLMCLYIGMQVVYRSYNRQTRLLSSALLISLLTFMVHSVFNAFLDTDKIAMPVFMAMAALVYYHGELKKEELPESYRSPDDGRAES